MWKQSNMSFFKGRSRQARKVLSDELKSDNLQYNTLVRWLSGTNDSSTYRLMFQALFIGIFFFGKIQPIFNAENDFKSMNFEMFEVVHNFGKSDDDKI